MTDKKTEALKLALEALEANRLLVNGDDKKGGLVFCMDGYYSGCFDIEPVNKQTNEAIAAIREALAQSRSDEEQPAQQEPVACKTLCELCVKRGYHFCANAAQTTPIPYPPASKPWVRLTDEEIAQSLEQYSDVIDPSHEFWKGITRAIEAAHGIKEKNT